MHPVALPAVTGDPELVAATGAKAPTGAPILESDYQRLISPPVRKRFAGGGGDRSKGRGARSGGGKAWGKGDAERRTSRSHHRAYTA